jgi:excisionase family DNA binding protein
VSEQARVENLPAGVPSDIITKVIVAERLTVTPRTVEEWVRKGIIPAIKLTGKAIRYHWPSVEKALLSRQSNVSPRS